VMPLRHAGAGMPRLRRDHRKRHAAHRETAGVVAQSVEIDGRVNPGRGASRAKRFGCCSDLRQGFPLA
jgi:hypothetical protein